MQNEDYRKYTYINLTFTVALTLISAILSIYLKSIGYSDPQLGLLFSLFPITVALFIPVIGNISDVIGKKNIIMISIAAEIIAYILYMLNHIFILIVIARILDGLATTTMTTIALARAEDGILTNRGEKSGIFLSIGQIGKLIAPPVSVFLADRFFIRFPFMIALAILLVLLVLLFDKDDLDFGKLQRKDLNYITSIRRYLEHHELRGMAILGIAAHMAQPATVVFLPLFIIEKLGMPMNYAGLAMLILGIPYLFQFYFGRISDQLSPRYIVPLGLFISALGHIALFFIDTFFGLSVMLLVVGIGGAMWNVSAWHLMSGIGEKTRSVGLVTSSYLGLVKLGAFPMFIASGFIVERTSFQLLSFINGITMVIAIAAAYSFLSPKAKY